MERSLRSRRETTTFLNWIEDPSSEDSDMQVDEEEIHEELDALDW